MLPSFHHKWLGTLQKMNAVSRVFRGIKSPTMKLIIIAIIISNFYHIYRIHSSEYRCLQGIISLLLAVWLIDKSVEGPMLALERK
jgi:hypothetical protein